MSGQIRDSSFRYSPVLDTLNSASGPDSSLTEKKGGGKLSAFLKSKTKNELIIPQSLLKKQKKKVDFHARVYTDVNYIYSGSTPGVYNGTYTRTGFAPSFSVFGIPLNGDFVLATQNNQLRFDYSSASLQFDMPKYKSQLKENYLKYISDIYHYYSPDIAKGVSTIADTIKRKDTCEKVILSVDYETKLNTLINKVKLLEDSAKFHPLDSNQINRKKTFTDSVKMMQAFANDYQTAQKYINSHPEDLKKYHQYQDFIKTVKNATDITDIPRVYQDLKTKHLLDKKTGFLASLQKFSIGKISLNYSPFTLYNQNIYGINIEYLIKNIIYIGGGAGMPAALNFGFSPQFFLQPNNTLGSMKRFLIFMRLGIGKVKENHLHLIYYGYGQKFDSNNPFSANMPPANSVLSLDFLQFITKDIKFSGEVAISNSSYLFRSASFEPIGKNDSTKTFILNYAARIGLDGVIKKTQTTFNVKLQIVSNNFSTVGNPFLRKDYMESSINLHQDFFDKKVGLSDIISQNITGLTTAGNSLQFISNNINLTYKVKSNINYSCSYIYSKSAPLGTNENPTNYTSHTVSLTQQYTAKIKKVRATTSLTSLLSTSKNISGETNSSTISLQNGIKESFFFKNGISFQPGCGINYTNLSSIGIGTDAWHLGYWIDAGNSFNIKKGITIQYTARYSIDKIVGNSLNANATATIKLYKNLELNARCQIMLLQSPTPIPGNQTTNAGGGLSYKW